MKNNPIPPDQAIWGRFDELAEHNRDVLHEILEAGRQARPRPRCHHPPDRRLSTPPAWMKRPSMPRASRRSSRNSRASARLRTRRRSPRDRPACTSLGVDALFDFSSGQDFKDSNAVIAQFDQGGSRPARPRLLSEGRRQVRRAAPEVPGARAAHAGPGGREAGAGQSRCRHGHAVRNRPGQGIARPGLAPRPRKGLPQDEQAGTGRRSARLSAGTNTSRPPGRPRSKSINVAWPGLLQGHERRHPKHPSGRLENLSHLAPAAHLGAAAALGVRAARISISTARR